MGTTQGTEPYLGGRHPAALPVWNPRQQAAPWTEEYELWAGSRGDALGCSSWSTFQPSPRGGFH